MGEKFHGKSGVKIVFSIATKVTVVSAIKSQYPQYTINATLKPYKCFGKE